MKTPHTAPVRDHLRAVGEAIYGEQFKPPLARAMRLDLRTIQRWASDVSDLTWDHGAIADLRDILAEEHAEVLSREAALRTALADLGDALLYWKLREAKSVSINGGDWGEWNLVGWQPDPRSVTLQDHIQQIAKLQGELSQMRKKVRDLEDRVAVLQKPKQMSFNISSAH